MNFILIQKITYFEKASSKLKSVKMLEGILQFKVVQDWASVGLITLDFEQCQVM